MNYDGKCTPLSVLESLSRESSEKPPLGLVPKSIHDHHRVVEIIKAMNRYAEVGRYPELAWVDELLELCELNDQGIISL